MKCMCCLYLFPKKYYAFKEGDKSEAYDDYSVYGGLPAVVLMNTEEQKTNYLNIPNEERVSSGYRGQIFCTG